MTPKIIHFLWLNFNNKADGVLDETLTFFKNRIETLHPAKNGWEINFISSWDDCMTSIAGKEWLIDLLNNEHVGAAHKSDALRYYYLYTMGGVWVDLSTFLVTSLDNLVAENKEGFTCYYIPSDVCASWLITLTSDIYEGITMQNYVESIIPIQEKLIKIENQNFNFITENYFLIFSKEHEICLNVLNQLKVFWTTALPHINSKEDYCYELNKLIFDLIQKAYILNIDIIPYLNLVKSLPNAEKIILKEYFDCGYIFNYLQLYLAVRDYSTTYSGELSNISNSPQKEETINLEGLSKFSHALCKSHSCNNKVITFADPNKNINLLSASYNRLSKWSDDRNLRISWEHTLAGYILTGDDPQKVLDELLKIEIYQLKYGALTRKSPSIDSLKKLFTDYRVVSGGGLLLKGGIHNKIRKKKSIKRKNKLSKKTYKKSSKKYKGPRGGIYLLRKGKKIYI